MGLAGKGKYRSVGMGHREGNNPVPKKAAAAQPLWFIAICNPAPMSLDLAIFQEKQEIWIFFFFCKMSWQLIQIFKKHPVGQTKHFHRLSWPTGCQLLASSLKEMGRTRSM